MKFFAVIILLISFVSPLFAGRCSDYYGCGQNGQCWSGCGEKLNGPNWCYTTGKSVCSTTTDCRDYRFAFVSPLFAGRCTDYYGCGKNGTCWSGCGKNLDGPEWCYTSGRFVCKTTEDCRIHKCNDCVNKCKVD
ncbi:unnamed protein product [Brachionus calyciflorus]|uniref:Uncharacterized protein n=1 Tax=Brachionus calyciflorus TaxID=104777 RepID=A0A814MC83_9BILA|nr:unnamed protein product [Brachionus calyciflorus]